MNLKIINFSSKVTIDLILRLSGLITLPIISRGLGPDRYGLYNYLITIASYYLFFFDFGFTFYGSNEIIRTKQVKTVVNDILSYQLTMGIIVTVLLFVSGFFYFDLSLLLILFIIILSNIIRSFNIFYYYLSQEKIYLVSVAQLIGQIIFIALIVTVFLSFKKILTLVIIGFVMQLSVSSFLFIKYLLKNDVVIAISIKNVVKVFRKVFYLGIAGKMEAITTSFIILILGIFQAPYEVGIYAAAYKIFVILLGVIQGFTFTFFPSIIHTVNNDNYEKISLLFYIYLIFGLILGSACFFGSEIIITLLYGSKYVESILVLKYFGITIGLWPIIMFLGTTMITFNNYNFYLYIALISAASSVIFSLILIQFYGLSGAIVVLPISAVITIISGLFLLRKVLEKKDISYNINSLLSIRLAYKQLSLNR